MRKLCILSRDKRALSPIFATVLLAAIILIFGSVAYFYASNVTTTTTNNYSSTISNSQQSIAERIGFENVVYSPSPANLTIYIINSGGSNSLKINSVFIYDSNNRIVGAYSGSSQISALSPISTAKPSPTPITGNALNIGKEAYFYIMLSGPPLNVGSIYTLHLVTQSGSAFDYEFTP
ncbi:MAG: archaellin/type IV pilin N-terminal domain-containing protein [Legionellales bacterium]